MKVYTPRHQWLDVYFFVGLPAWLNPRTVGTSPRGVRYGIWPFYFESYVSETPPDLAESQRNGPAPLRTVLWTRPSGGPVPRGWWRTGKKNESDTYGYVNLSRPGHYTEYWTRTAKNERNRWNHNHLDKTHYIDSATLDEFIEAYKKSTVYRGAGKELLPCFERVYKKNRNAARLFVVRNTTEEIEAGIGVFNSLSAASSYYYIGFYLSSVEKTPSMVGLIDHWFSQCEKEGIRVAHLGGFYKKGDPLSWKGFSKFKSKFGPEYIEHHAPLMRFLLPVNARKV